MFSGKGLRCLICFFMFALAAVQAARPGLQSSAVTAQTWGRTCHDISGTENDEVLREYGLKSKKSWRDMFRWQKRSQKRCFCDTYYAPHPSKECGDVEDVEDDRGSTWRSFGLGAAGPGCRCLKGFEKARERSELVQAAAVRFCAAVVEETTKAAVVERHVVKSAQQNIVKKDLKVTPQLCQEILTGTLGHFNTSSQTKEVFNEANQLSNHAETKGWGHLDPLVTDPFPSATDHQILLHHVCKDECHEIVNETLENIQEMTADVHYAKPSEESCADRVVRQVEAEILGCCGRSCGWDGRSCGSWPFLTKAEKVDWMQQCCSEYNVLQGSSRERMCNSVLSPEQIRLVSQFDTKPKKGDVGGAYIGQDPRLLWRKAGLDKFRQQLKNMKPEPPKEDEPVSSDFFEKNPDVRKEGIQKGWFHEEKDPEELAASLAQLGASTCEVTLQNMMSNHKHCPAQTWRNVKEACFQERLWQISDKPNPDDDDLDGPPECQLKMMNSDLNRPKEVATPEECLKVDFGQVVKRRFFIYNNSNPPEGKLILDNPILCFHEKDRCPDEEDFVRKNLNEFERFNDFREYMYWAKEA